MPYREYECVVQCKETDAIELEIALPVQELQSEGLHLVVEEIVAQHKGGLLLHDLVHNHRRLLGVIVGIAAEAQHNVGHHHGGEAPDDIQIGHVVQQAALAAHYEVDLCLEEYAKDADHEACSHIGHTLWPELSVGQNTQREYLVMQLKQIRQIGLRSGATVVIKMGLNQSS